MALLRCALSPLTVGTLPPRCPPPFSTISPCNTPTLARSTSSRVRVRAIRSTILCASAIFSVPIRSTSTYRLATLGGVVVACRNACRMYLDDSFAISCWISIYNYSIFHTVIIVNKSTCPVNEIPYVGSLAIDAVPRSEGYPDLVTRIIPIHKQIRTDNPTHWKQTRKRWLLLLQDFAPPCSS